VLGIDPAKGPANVAIAKGIRTLNRFFTRELAESFCSEGLSADLFLANNVLAHVSDLNGFVAGVEMLLKDQGALVAEVPYVIDLVRNCEFDTIYHQHLCYFSVTALDHLFRCSGLFLNDVAHTPIHGGSLRLFVEKTQNVQPSVRSMLEEEKRLRAETPQFFENFGVRVRILIDTITHTLRGLKEQGCRIAGYGAAAKACTLMNVSGIDSSLLDYLIDLNPFKQGRYMSGNHLLIRAPESLYTEPVPDHVLILAWNFADEIIAQHHRHAERGGRFIIPVPQVQLI
jgi:hypothetical protein